MRLRKSEILDWINHKLLAVRLKFGVKSLKQIETNYQKQLAKITVGISMLMKKRKHVRGVLNDIKKTKELLIKELG